LDELKKVVILGGGFGGVHAFLNLGKYAKKDRLMLTLISRDDYFLFTPLLHEVVSGRVGDRSVQISLSDIVKRTKNAHFMHEEVLSIDTSAKLVKTGGGEVSYDILVVALGAKVNFFGVPGAEKLPVLKTLSSAQGLRGKISSFRERPRKKKQKIIIIGGGATGVELAAEVADILKLPKTKEKFEMTVIEGREDILSSSNIRLREVARRSLEKRGVRIVPNCIVQKIETRRLETKEGRAMRFDLAVWSAGVKAVDISFYPPQPKSSAHRLKVLSTLQLENLPDIFALGDIADGYPQTAQVAVAQAKVAAKNIRASLKNKPLSPFVYKHAGMLFSLGRWMAGAEVKIFLLNKVFYFWGVTAWFLWHAAYLTKIPGMKNKLRIARDWIRSWRR